MNIKQTPQDTKVPLKNNQAFRITEKPQKTEFKIEMEK